jgi:hypothetical protein
MTKTETFKRRIMGELVCLDGDAEAEAVGARLHAAGFKFKVTDDRDECSDVTRYMMLWIDKPPGESKESDEMEFVDYVGALIGETPNTVGIVAPDHVPTKFGDFGEWPTHPRGLPTKASA